MKIDPNNLRVAGLIAPLFQQSRGKIHEKLGKKVRQKENRPQYPQRIQDMKPEKNENQKRHAESVLDIPST